LEGKTIVSVIAIRQNTRNHFLAQRCVNAYGHSAAPAIRKITTWASPPLCAVALDGSMPEGDWAHREIRHLEKVYIEKVAD
jgi:hypothetical protein